MVVNKHQPSNGTPDQRGWPQRWLRCRWEGPDLLQGPGVRGEMHKLRRHLQRGDALTEFFPFGSRKDHQATVRVLGDGQVARSVGAEHVAMASRHRKPTFRIETEG